MKKTSVAVNSLPKINLLSKTGNIFLKMGRFLSRRSTIVEIICTLYIILFIYTGLNKMMDIDKFKFEMGRSPFIQNMAGLIAYTLPAGEMLLALLLIFKRTKLLGLYLSFALMALFTGYIWIMLNYAYDLPCSCGGIISKLSWHEHLVFNGIFTAFGVIGIILQRSLHSKDA
jgi:hypothetical protein